MTFDSLSSGLINQTIHPSLHMDMERNGEWTGVRLWTGAARRRGRTASASEPQVLRGWRQQSNGK